MDNRFHEDAAEHVEPAAPVDDHVGFSAAPRTAPAARPVSEGRSYLYESNSYHGAAIRTAEQARLSKLYPRLHL